MGRTDGRLAPVRVYVATIPKRSGARRVLLRVLRETSTRLDVRVTSLPGEPSFTRTWTVPRIDLDSMIATDLARRISFWTCNDCTARMTLQHAQRGRKAVVVLACSNCEQTVEV